jgi:hypothetical protein
MSDTIELLETIGKNASLRHASAQDLAQVLDQADASHALKAAAMHGDRTLLAAELGGQKEPMRVDHHSNAPGHGHDHDHDHHHDHDHDHPKHDPQHQPDHGKPSHD